MHPTLAGQLADFDLAQLIMVLEAAQTTGVLEITSPYGKGYVGFEMGQIVLAEAGTVHGGLAAYYMLSWDEREFSFAKGSEIGKRNTERSSQGLCLEAMRLIDESRDDRITFNRLDGVDPEKLTPAGRRIISLLGKSGVTGSVSKAGGLSRLEAYYHLEELERFGAVSRADPANQQDSPVAPQREKDKQIRVLVVDDSLFMQKVLKRTYKLAPDILVVGTASNGKEALELLPKLKPDLISLDLYMPVMDGVTTLKRIMLSQPTPTVVVTSARAEDLEKGFEAILRFGAIDFITKPSQMHGSMDEQAENIVSRLRKAARVNLRGIRMYHPPVRARQQAVRGKAQGAIIALGGTGGCLSYMQFLTSLPIDLPFAVIGLLRFPESFLRAFVSYLKTCATFDVELASDGAPIESGVCYLAGAGEPPRIEETASGPILRVDELQYADHSGLFMGAAATFGEKAIGLLLSGEGEEGFPGIAAIKEAGGITLAQLPDSCVDPEQTQRAIERGLIDRVVRLSHISNDLSQIMMTRLRQSIARPVQAAESEAPWPNQSV